MILERVTQIELNTDEQRRITLDYLQQRKESNLRSMNYWQTTPKFKNSRCERNMKSELSALDAVIKILENEI